MEKKPEFLVNEFLEEGIKELENVLHEIKRKPSPYEKKALFFKEFTASLFNAYKKQIKKEIKKPEIKIKAPPKPAQPKPLPSLEPEKIKEEIIQSFPKVRLKEIPLPEIPIPKPQPVQKEEKEYNLILSRISSKPLVKVLITDIYSLIEPELTEEQKAKLQKLKKSKVSQEELLNPKKLEKLISKDLEEMEKIRYYLVRDLINIGKIAPLIDDRNVKEIICEKNQIKIKYREVEMQTNISVNQDEINEIINNIAQKVNVKLSKNNPFLSTVFKGLTIQASLGSEYMEPSFVIKK